MRPYRSRLQRVTMARTGGVKEKRDYRRKIRKLVLNRRPPYIQVLLARHGQRLRAAEGYGLSSRGEELNAQC